MIQFALLGVNKPSVHDSWSLKTIVLRWDVAFREIDKLDVHVLVHVF